MARFTEYGYRIRDIETGKAWDVWPNVQQPGSMTLDEIKTRCKKEGYTLITYDRTPVRVVSIRD